jgi:hypothetical protein
MRVARERHRQRAAAQAPAPSFLPYSIIQAHVPPLDLGLA